MLRQTISWPVCLGIKPLPPPSGAQEHVLLLSDSCGFLEALRYLWREDRSVVYNCSWPSPVQSFWGLTIFYCLRCIFQSRSKQTWNNKHNPGNGHDIFETHWGGKTRKGQINIIVWEATSCNLAETDRYFVRTSACRLFIAGFLLDSILRTEAIYCSETSAIPDTIRQHSSQWPLWVPRIEERGREIEHKFLEKQKLSMCVLTQKRNYNG
jgi:hypothetical protein